MIDTMTARTSSEDLLDLVPDTEEPATVPTPKQRELIEKLTNELRGLDADLAELAGEYTAHMDTHNLWTPGREGNISRWIDRLIGKVSELRKAQPTAGIEDGMYVLDGTIYKVQHAVHGSGNQYAKRLVAGAPGERASFEYAPGVVRKLRPEHRMTMDQAREFGKITGMCVFCSKVLTDERSIDAGYGQKCASNNGLPWG